MRPGPALGLVGLQGAPVFAVLEVGRRIVTAATLRLHAAAGDELAQHVADEGPPLVLGGSATLGMDDPLEGLSTESFGQLAGAVSEEVAQPAFTVGAHVQKPLDGRGIAPFQLNTVCPIGTVHAFFPGLES